MSGAQYVCVEEGAGGMITAKAKAPARTTDGSGHIDSEMIAGD